MSRELRYQGVDPTDDYVTYGNTAHFDPFDTCPYCYKTMEWMGCPHCEMSGLYDGRTCPLCVGHGGWYSCDDCELVVTLDQQVTELKATDE